MARIICSLILVCGCQIPDAPAGAFEFDEAAPAASALGADTCATAPYLVAPLPYFETASTSGIADDHNISASGNCAAGFGCQFGGSGTGADLVFKFNTDVDCDLDVEMWTYGADMNVTVVTDCAAMAATCEGVDDCAGGNSPENVFFTALTGVDYYAVVDGYNGAEGLFDLLISETSSTGCSLIVPPVICDGTNDGLPCDDGVACTDDICVGGACAGTPDDTNFCADADVLTEDSCVAGSCVSVPARRFAECQTLSPTVAPMPYTLLGDTTTATDVMDLDSLGVCLLGGFQDSSTGEGPDDIYLVQFSADCDVSLTLTQISNDIGLSVFTSCGDLPADCLGVSDFNSSQDWVDFSATAGTDYYVVADGSGGDFGAYTLLFEEGFGTDTGCELGRPPVVCDGTNDGSPCDDNNPCTYNGLCAGGVCQDGPVNDAGACDDGNDCTDDECAAGTCLSTANDANSCDDGDGCTSDTCISGTCQLTLNPACPACNATTWQTGSLPLTLIGDTRGNLDDVDIEDSGGCPGVGSVFSGNGEGPEDIYRFHVDLDCELTVRLTTQEERMVVYVATDCSELNDTCVATAQTGFSSGVAAYDFQAVAGTDYFMIVDGDDGTADAYQLEISEASAQNCSLIIPTVVCDGTNDSEPCDDGAPCTDIGACVAGICETVANDFRTCEDGNPCTVDTCTAGDCISVNDDGNECDDENACTDDQCQAGVCTSVNNDTNVCTDGILCTTDACAAGACVGTPTDCTGLDGECRAGLCNPSTGLCDTTAANGGVACDDGDPCTETDACLNGFCAGSPVDCTLLDGVCQLGACDNASGLCEPAIRDCSSLDDVCVVGFCDVPTDTCVPTVAADGASCDDGDPCTEGDTCASGGCVGTPKVCTADCNTGSCDPVSGGCAFTPADEGVACDDADGCTDSDTCRAGTCAGDVLDCSGLTDDCNVGGCDPFTNACVAIARADGEFCDDGDACTKLDVCTAGTCSGEGKVCTGLTDDCSVGVCDPVSGDCVGDPRLDGTECDNQDGCQSTCSGGTCVSPSDCVAVDQGDGPLGGDSDGPGVGSGCNSNTSESSSSVSWMVLIAALFTLRRRFGVSS